MAGAYLETRRLILCRFQQTDPEDLYGYLSDRETLRHEPYLPMDREQTQAELTQRIADKESTLPCFNVTMALCKAKEVRTMAEAYLETRRLILRRFQQTDPEDLYGYLSDRETLRHEPYLPMDR